LKKDINLELDVKQEIDNCFIAKYSGLFSLFLERLSPQTRDIIRKNKELNDLFDLFLDFILDSSQHLDYKEAKKQEKNILNS